MFAINNNHMMSKTGPLAHKLVYCGPLAHTVVYCGPLAHTVIYCGPLAHTVVYSPLAAIVLNWVVIIDLFHIKCTFISLYYYS